MKLIPKFLNPSGPILSDEEYNKALEEEMKKAKTALLKKQRDDIVQSNDNLWVESNDPSILYHKNPHLEKRGLEGAKSHSQWVKDHPNIAALETVLGALPFAVASVPLAGATVEAFPAVASTLAPGSAFWTNPLTRQVVASTLMGEGTDALTKQVTGKSWGDNVSDIVQNTTGWNPNSTWYGNLLTGMTNPGWYSDPTKVTALASKALTNPGRTFFLHLPYKQLDKIINLVLKGGEEFTRFMRSSPNELPLYLRSKEFRALRHKVQRRPRVNIEDVTLDQSVTPNSLLDAYTSMINRYKYLHDNNLDRFDKFDGTYGAFDMNTLDPVKANLEKITIKDYLSIPDIYKMERSDNVPTFYSLVRTPIDYARLNFNPGFNNNNLIYINPKHLKDLGFNISDVLSHEMSHALDARLITKPLSEVGFNRFTHLQPQHRDYLTGRNATELSARGTQLKNYFGILDDSPITSDMLKYAAKHYVKDTGMDNNMSQFFSGIKDWDKAALWLSIESLKKGGKLNSK